MVEAMKISCKLHEKLYGESSASVVRKIRSQMASHWTAGYNFSTRHHHCSHSWPGAHCTHDFSIKIQIWLKIDFALICMLMKWLLQNFAYATIAVLSSVSLEGMELQGNNFFWIERETLVKIFNNRKKMSCMNLLFLIDYSSVQNVIWVINE